MYARLPALDSSEESMSERPAYEWVTSERFDLAILAARAETVAFARESGIMIE